MTLQERARQTESATLKARAHDARTLTAAQLNAKARATRAAQDKAWRDYEAMANRVLSETGESLRRMAARSGRKSETPRLDSMRRKMRLVVTKPATPASRTPKLDRMREKIEALERSLVADGALAKVDSFDETGRRDGYYLWSHDGKVKPRWVPNDYAKRRLRLMALRAG